MPIITVSKPPNKPVKMVKPKRKHRPRHAKRHRGSTGAAFTG
jgi:hypothetical protein